LLYVIVHEVVSL